MSELSRRHGVSRKTAYKVISRFKEAGVEGLEGRSGARHHQPYKTPAKIERRIVALKQRYPAWGPRKLLIVLERRSPDVAWPARSTVGDILRRHGLVTPRPKHCPMMSSSDNVLEPATEPNDLWCTDFKGYRFSAKRAKLEPLTLGDAFRPFSLACTLVKSTSLKVGMASLRTSVS